MKNSLYFLFLLIAALLCCLYPAQAAEMAGFSISGGQEVITLAVGDTSPHKVFVVPNPDRLVVDVPAIPGRHDLSLPSSYPGKLIKSMRFGQFDPDTSRFVFDLVKPVQVISVEPEGKSLVIRIATGGKAEMKSSVPVKKAEAEEPKAKPQKFKTPLRRGQKPVIVIDPGHGGVDPGTIGPSDTYEKDITLAYAKALKAKLLRTNRYRVKLTRDDDRFIMLRKRVAIARQAGADMFISLHADSAEEEAARGLSIYTVSEQASDREAEALAARENKSDILAGVDLSDERDDVAGILISLAQRDTKNRSATLADELVLALGDKIHLLVNTHRFAGFAVLKAPDVPSVLIEIGFLSHPQEEKMIKSKTYREKVTSGIAAGIDAYFQQQKKMGMP